MNTQLKFDHHFSFFLQYAITQALVQHCYIVQFRTANYASDELLQILYSQNLPHNHIQHFSVSFSPHPVYYICIINCMQVQSFPNTACGYKRLLLAALACLPTSQQGIILTLFPNTHYVISFNFQVDGHAHQRTFVKRRCQNLLTVIIVKTLVL